MGRDQDGLERQVQGLVRRVAPGDAPLKECHQAVEFVCLEGPAVGAAGEAADNLARRRSLQGLHALKDELSRGEMLLHQGGGQHQRVRARVEGGAGGLLGHADFRRDVDRDARQVADGGVELRSVEAPEQRRPGILFTPLRAIDVGCGAPDPAKQRLALLG